MTDTITPSGPDSHAKLRRTTAAHMLELFGDDEQLGQVIEECAELTKAIRKRARGIASRTRAGFGDGESLECECQAIANEGADVSLMMEQVRLIVGADRWRKANDLALERAGQLIVDEQRLRIARGEDSALHSAAYGRGYKAWQLGDPTPTDQAELEGYTAAMDSAMDEQT